MEGGLFAELDKAQQGFHIIQDTQLCKEAINVEQHLCQKKLTIAR